MNRNLGKIRLWPECKRMQTRLGNSALDTEYLSSRGSDPFTAYAASLT